MLAKFEKLHNSKESAETTDSNESRTILSASSPRPDLLSAPPPPHLHVAVITGAAGEADTQRRSPHTGPQATVDPD